ncbi:Methyltransferase-like protein 13 [Tetrabaena socialis]|uniref:Methyltransferase-like protein 13 n=1 Tax=Tetrabaena socialis TaxID=47790 RepID=A0A2J8ABD3_9CHLO|nr:Methyltransferase-like protein 13 [Tetrabaena socialis]|eukprot:PNH09834.1 Methyltransferase-like protein 13 [Tetrabaena socialis]
MPNYGEFEYWDERYAREPAAFDWYQGYTGLKTMLHRVFPLESRLLQIGVGSSRLQEDMVKAGWQSIVNVDYSRVIIGQMAELHKGYEQLEYSVADARSMPEIEDATFDGVLDKGTLDAVLCGEQSAAGAAAMLAECYRVLKPGCCLLLVTYGDPSSRLPHLAEVPGWAITVWAVTRQEAVEALDAEPVVRPLLKGPYPATNADCMDALSGLEGMHFIYVCRKEERGEPGDADTGAAAAMAGAAGFGLGEEANNAEGAGASVD